MSKSNFVNWQVWIGYAVRIHTIRRRATIDKGASKDTWFVLGRV